MLTSREKFAVFSPLLAYLVYVAFLVSSSERPFLLRWVEGCFGLFAALLLCNFLRRAYSDRAGEREEQDGESPPHDG